MTRNRGCWQCRLAEYDLTLDGALLEQRGPMMMNNSTREFERLLGRAAVCTENLIRVDAVMESPKLAE
jgi:hypothetical protein